MKKFKVLALVTMLTMVLTIAAIAYQVDVYKKIAYTGDTVPEVTKLPGAKLYVVTFLDANLEAAVRDALGKPTGDITKKDMAKLTNLEAYRRGITNLSGLEYAVNLTSLDLSENQITDITPLAGLTNLTWLELEFIGKNKEKIRAIFNDNV
ncbi:leucine-rich repeat domain-containing protein [Peptococcaceae bacterium]|nr:leucine-rich repeat domain-containing protein [Peptococcaceae bacterium]